MENEREDPYEPVFVAQLVESPPQPIGFREQIDQTPLYSWILVLVTTIGSVLAFLFTSVIALVIGIFIITGGEMPAEVDAKLMGELMLNRAAFTLSVLLPQLSLLVLPIIAVFLLPSGPRQSLKLVRGNWPLWAWISVGLATPLVGSLLSLLMSPFMDDSEALKAMTESFRHHGTSGFLIPLAMLIGITPSICEEILFRGFLQPRLTRLIPPVFGVVLASLAFAIMHMDPVHVIAVFPLGLWLGFVSYQSGSLFPAMIAHLVNNVLSVVSLSVSGEEAEMVDAPPLEMLAFILVGGVIGLVGVLVAWRRFRRVNDGQLPIADATDPIPQPS